MTLITQELAAYLQDNAVAALGVNMFCENMPEEPDECLSLVQYTGRAPEATMNNPGVMYQYPRVQIKSRALSTETAYQLCEQAYLALAQLVNFNRLLRAWPQSMPYLVGRDSNQRTQYAFNVEVVQGL